MPNHRQIPHPSIFCQPILLAFIAAITFSSQFCWSIAAELDQGNLLVLDMAGLSPRELPVENGDENPFLTLDPTKRGIIAPHQQQSPQQQSFLPATMRNALIRFGRSPRSQRSSATMRNALVRFGKRSSMPMPMIGVGFDDEMAALNGIDGVGEQRSIGAKRNSGAPPQPFVRFGRSPQRRMTVTASGIDDGENSQKQQSAGFAFAFL